MKRKLFLAVVSLFFVAGINAQSSVIFSENMGDNTNGSSTSTITIAKTVFQNSGVGNISFSGSGDTRTTTPSSGYATVSGAGASGLRNVFLTNTAGTSFTISGIDISDMTNIAVYAGVSKSATAESGNDLSVTAIVDGGAPVQLSFAAFPTGTGTTGWRYVSFSGTIPTGQSLTLSFTNTIANTTSNQFRLDDIAVTAVVAKASTTPIIMDSFSVVHSSGGALLSWNTRTEINASYFDVEKSLDGKTFTTLTNIAAKNIASGASYSYIDNSYQNGIAYYRLKMYDADNTFKISNIVVVTNATTSNSVSLKYTLAKNKIELNNLLGSADVRVINVSGATLIHQSVSVTNAVIDVSMLPRGIYFIQLSDSNQKDLKFIKQ